MISVFSICQPLFFTSFIFASWSAFCRLCFGFDAGIAPSSTDQSGARSCGPDRFVRFLVGLPPSGDLLPCAKHLFVAARTVWVRQETTALRGFRPSAAAVYVGFGSWSCENALAEALTRRDFGEVAMLGHFAGLGAFLSWKCSCCGFQPSWAALRQGTSACLRRLCRHRR